MLFPGSVLPIPLSKFRYLGFCLLFCFVLVGFLHSGIHSIHVDIYLILSLGLDGTSSYLEMVFLKYSFLACV